MWFIMSYEMIESIAMTEQTLIWLSTNCIAFWPLVITFVISCSNGREFYVIDAMTKLDAVEFAVSSWLTEHLVLLDAIVVLHVYAR